MPELDFKGKEFVRNHHLTVPYRPLVPDAAKSIGEPDLDGNLIIHGDNLEALKALLPKYAGKVDCIFIDPPYNTGKDDWEYSDNVNSPLMRAWLSENPVNIDDALRHDKWCAMMWPRLKLLYDLLSEAGVIFICIDNNEIANLRALLDELFGEQNIVGTIVWNNATDNNPTLIAPEHEYVHVYAKSKVQLDSSWRSGNSGIKDKLVEIGNEFVRNFSDPDKRQRAYTNWFKENKPFL